MNSNEKTFNNNTEENLPSGSKRPAEDDPEAYGNHKRHGKVTVTYVLNPEQGQGENAVDAISAIIEKNATNVFEAIIEENASDAIEELVPEVPSDVITPFSELTTEAVLTTLSTGSTIDVVNVDQEKTAVSASIYLTIEKELNNEDPLQTWPYAMDAFSYLKEREKMFIIKDYMSYQLYVNPWRRRLLISWMVNVHQSLGTYRESLFLSVKIVDLYLCRFVVEERRLELLGAAAIYIASKFETRKALPMYGLLQSCKSAFNRADLLEMEWRTLCGIGFDLGIPIAYRFLRRYARSAKLPEFIWTLGSYILELALMEYTTIRHSDSQLAGAALFMALRMCGHPKELDENTWDRKLVYYSGYELQDFARLVPVLNALLHRSERETDKAVRNLYSTPLLFRVATVLPLSNEELFRNNPNLLSQLESAK